MSSLTYLNDASVLHNLKQRYYNKLIYVRPNCGSSRMFIFFYVFFWCCQKKKKIQLSLSKSALTTQGETTWGHCQVLTLSKSLTFLRIDGFLVYHYIIIWLFESRWEQQTCPTLLIVITCYFIQKKKKLMIKFYYIIYNNHQFFLIVVFFSCVLFI